MGHRAPVEENACEGSPKVEHLTDDLREVADLRQLRIFHSLAHTGSFTATASLMSVTQSAVSHSVKALEKSLGMDLLVRRGRQTTLTAEGETLLASTSEIIRELGRASQRLSQLRNGELNTLRFGSSDTICEFLLPQILALISDEVPEANIILKIGDAEELLGRLNDGSIDMMLGIGALPSKHTQTSQTAPLFNDHLRLITSERHRWHTERRQPEIDDLSGERILLFGRQSESNRLVRDWLLKSGVHDVRMVDVRTFGTLRNLVSVDFGVGLAPNWVLGRDGMNLPHFRLPGEPIVRRWNLVMRKTHAFSPLERRFLTLLEESTSLLGKAGEGQNDLAH